MTTKSKAKPAEPADTPVEPPADPAVAEPPAPPEAEIAASRAPEPEMAGDGTVTLPDAVLDFMPSDPGYQGEGTFTATFTATGEPTETDTIVGTATPAGPAGEPEAQPAADEIAAAAPEPEAQPEAQPEQPQDRESILRSWGVPEPPGGTYQDVYPSAEGGQQNALFAVTAEGRFLFRVGVDQAWMAFYSTPGIAGTVMPLPPEVAVQNPPMSARVARAMGLSK